MTRSVRAIQNFVLDDLSNWYVRRSRRRYWSFELTDDKKQAYLTLYQILVEVSKMIAPFSPFIADEIFINLTENESVHLEDYPTFDASYIDEELETDMQTIIDLVSLGRAARNKCQIKVRQTLQALYVPEKCESVVQKMEHLIKEEINVKEICFIKQKDDFVEYDTKVNYKTMGPKFGKHVKHIAEAMKNIDGNHIVKALHSGKDYFLEIDGSTFKISEEDVFITIKEKEGFVFESDKEFFVALDTKLTPQLIAEGYAREIVNKIQFTRKDMDFEIMDRISIYFHADEEIQDVFQTYSDYIKEETLTNTIHYNPTKEKDMQKWDINGKEVFLSIVKIL